MRGCYTLLFQHRAWNIKQKSTATLTFWLCGSIRMFLHYYIYSRHCWQSSIIWLSANNTVLLKWALKCFYFESITDHLDNINNCFHVKLHFYYASVLFNCELTVEITIWVIHSLTSGKPRMITLKFSESQLFCMDVGFSIRCTLSVSGWSFPHRGNWTLGIPNLSVYQFLWTRMLTACVMLISSSESNLLFWLVLSENHTGTKIYPLYSSLMEWFTMI